jgi:hypothetical protein
MRSSKKLSYSLDPDLLHKELTMIKENWQLHFNKSNYQGNWSAIALRAPKESNVQVVPNDFGNTGYVDLPILENLDYIQSIVSAFECPVQSMRFLRLSSGAIIKEHKDSELDFWNGLVRFHIPIITNEHVDFRVAGQRLNMKVGELWFADFSKTHSVRNEGETDRIHLVIDCEVNGWLRKLFEKEGIIEPGETKPDPVDQYSRQTHLQMVQAFQEMGTETSLRLAEEMIKKYNLNL